MATDNKKQGPKSNKKGGAPAELTLDELDAVVGGAATGVRPEDEAAQAMNAATDAAMLGSDDLVAEWVDEVVEEFKELEDIPTPSLDNQDTAAAALTLALADQPTAQQSASFVSQAKGADVAELASPQVTQLGLAVASLSAEALGGLSAAAAEGLTVAQVSALGANLAGLKPSTLANLDAA